MRKELLSFLIACAVALAVFTAYHAFTRGQTGGAAFAAIGSGFDESIKGQKYSRSEKRALSRSISYNPEHILKMTGQDIRAALHEPGLIRREAPTIIWQYRSEACVLDIYFSTPQQDAGLATVVHYELRGRGQDGAEAGKTCVKDIIDAQNGPQMVDVSAFYKSP